MKNYKVIVELFQPARSKEEAKERVYLTYLKPNHIGRQAIKEVKVTGGQ